MNYAEHVSKKVTPQSEPIPGTTQVENNAGGFAWAVDDWTRLDRFLILGAEGGTYYASERKLTRENAAAVERLLKVDGPRVVARVVEISDAGRAPKNDPAVFALALAMTQADASTRAAARAAVPKVCRIGTHLFQLAKAVNELGGWGRGTKRAFANWYLSKTPDDLALQLAKYQSRDGMSHRDVLRLAHANPKTIESAVAPAEKWKQIDRLLRWAVGKVNVTTDTEPIGDIIDAFERAKTLAAGAAVLPKNATAEMAKLITDTALPRECVPTEFLNSPEVWNALLHAGKYGMPMTALIRNLGKMSAIGLLKPLSDATKFACDRLRDREALKAARVHPMQVLIALTQYGEGHGDKGKLSWQPCGEVLDALNDAFYATFQFIEPTGKRHLLALDVSGSMDTGRVAGAALTPRAASAAMAMVTARTEQRYAVVGFTASGGGYGGRWDSGRTGLTRIPELNAKSDLKAAIDAVSKLQMGGTDCSLPMLYATENKLEVDAFLVMTDSETWHGSIHPMQALRSYRQKMGIDAKLIVMGMVSSGFSIADPNDRGALDVVGFDSAVPNVIADFIR